MKSITKRGLLGLFGGAAIGLASLSGAAFADDAYPDRPITMLVGYGAGGQTDLVARAAAQVMSNHLGQPINIANKPGAGGAVAARELAKAKPDGYTMLFQSNSVVNTSPFIMEGVNYTPDDFEYAGMITTYQLGMATQKDSPFNTMSEYVAWAKENPGSSYGALSPEARLYIGALIRDNDLDINIVPLQSGSEMINALLGNQVALAFSGGLHYRYPDELKSISALTTFRHPSAPDVLTIAEEGYPMAMDSRTTLFLPKGTPRAILDRLAEALAGAETDEGFKKITAAADIPIQYYDVDESYAEMRESYANNKAIIESAAKAAQ
ncbi:Bug family tripartite tricarboxylate transporter substrate binding protein [Martelella soudanensis]|uniref:Bug family tripartite tricarboxylate transporter substrate binding protein n=1 Tax=unclassified Martelella TaxID=2629616 RepID=UPI0015DF6FDB|nr:MULTISPECIES: tripartite tricarboxylate transporter substrate binding protein [unclassified Martelella]